jgi:hypothetical protein
MTQDQKIKAVQSKLNLVADGDAGPKTWAALYSRIVGSSTITPSASIPERLVELAKKEVGVREHPRNTNRGKRVQEFQNATWLDGTGWAWCAAFICWLCREAGVKDSVRPKTAGAWDFERWARKASSPVKLYKPASKTKIQAGDILVFSQSHIGLASHSQGVKSVSTIEGNTDSSGSREGGGVYARSRRLSEVRSVIRFK